MKKFFIVFIVAFVTLFSACSIKSKEEYYNYSESNISGGDSVTIEITCSSVLDNMNKLDSGLEDYIPDDGIILEKTEYQIKENDTVYSVLSRAVRENQIQIEVQGSDENALSTVYVEGINYLYEFSCGSESGWIYKVNDEYAEKGCDSFNLKDGDEIQWIYICSQEDFSG